MRSLQIVSQEEGRRLGLSVNCIGDLNGDGLDDLAIGAQGPSSLSDDETAGWLYVLFGGYGEREEIDIADIGEDVEGFVLIGSSADQRTLAFGYVEGVGDVNGDEIDDLLVPVDGLNDGLGGVFVIYGNTEFDSILDASDLPFFGVEIRGVRPPRNRFGSSISGVGDVDGDGLDDFLVGEPGGLLGSVGAAYLIYGSEDWPEEMSVGDPELRLLELHQKEQPLGGRNPRLFGWWVEGVGDWNEDGFQDFAIGAPWQEVGLENYIGRTYLVYGGRDLPRSAFDADVGTAALPGLVLEGHRPVSGVGRAGDKGDMDGDGRTDLLVVSATNSWYLRDRSPSSVSIFYRKSFDAESFAFDALEPPGEGALEGGETVLLRGRGFDARTTVFFGGLEATNVRVVHSAFIEAVTPASRVEGFVDIEVCQGADCRQLSNAYRYRRRVLRDLVLSQELLRREGIRSTRIVGLGPLARNADMNADGISDLVVTSTRPFESVHVVYGRREWADVLTESDLTIRGDPDVVAFAWRCDVSTDLDGDGFNDFVIGGRLDAADPFTAPGETYLLRGYGDGGAPAEISAVEAAETG
ncbi:MAG: IPT/TIG domain-containing protein, partial [Planctomycetota bacterium]